MSEIETEFRGYAIRYSENQDVWRCHTLDMDGVTLTQLKNKIGRYLAKIAKTAEAIPAIHVEYGDGFKPCFIVAVANTVSYRKQPEVWTYTEREESYRGGGKRTVKYRKKYEASTLILDTPENQTLVAEAVRLVGLARLARKTAEDAIEAIPRIDVSTLQQDDTEDEAA